MDRSEIPADPHLALGPQRRKPLRALRERWWSSPYRRYMIRFGSRDHRHPLDERYVADAMARQHEELRNLPEVVG